MNNKTYLLALNRMPGVGSRTVARLLMRWPNLQALFELSPTAMAAHGLPDALVQAITHYDRRGVEADWLWQEHPSNHLLTWADSNYPALLKEIHDAPPVLYAKGDLSALDQLCVAMVGTRKPSPVGSETARHFAHALSEKGITVVSGLALGIDAQVHQGCLDAGGKTIAVMGTGIDVVYPYRHRMLAESISHQGLILSEFSLKTAPIAGHFPRRNRIISGLSLITLIVEAAVKSGSLITARLALEQNRDVMAIPGSIYNVQSRGCHYLLQQGAKLVTSVADVLEELNLDNSASLCNEKKVACALTNNELVRWIGFELTTVDQLMERSGLDLAGVTRGLAELELQGMVKSVAGGYMRYVHERESI